MNTRSALLLSTMFIITNITVSQFIRGPSKGTWDDALTYCNENENGLAVITTAEENTAASAACNAPLGHVHGCWTGLIVVDITGAPHNCKWAWEDNTPVSYGFIDGAAATQPDGGVWGTVPGTSFAAPFTCATNTRMIIERHTYNGWADNPPSSPGQIFLPLFPLCMASTRPPTSVPTTVPTTTPSKKSYHDNKESNHHSNHNTIKKSYHDN
eukprot:531394_1